MVALGAMWLHPDRLTYGRPVFTVELVYQDAPGSFDDLRTRFRRMRDKGVDIWIRIDKGIGQTLPALDQQAERQSFAEFCGKVAADPDYKFAKGLIIGNEPNLLAEGGIQPKWVMKVVCGFDTPADDKRNAFDQVRAAGSSMAILIPAVGPWNAQTHGQLTAYPPPPPGQSRALTEWEKYQSTLAWCAYHSSSHWGRTDVQFAMHTYSNVNRAESNPANEPNIDIKNPDWDGAQYGIRVYDELMHQIAAQAGGITPPNLVSEWNSYFPPSWPADNYPAGLMQNAVRYIASKPNVLGFAVFIDDYEDNDAWKLTAVTAYSPDANLSEQQKNKLRDWDRDFDAILRDGIGGGGGLGSISVQKLPSQWASATWDGGSGFVDEGGVAYAGGQGKGAFSYSFDLPPFEPEPRQAALSANLTSGLAGQESDVSVIVNYNDCGTYRVQAHNPGASGTRYLWLVPESALRPGQSNTIEFRVRQEAQLANGVSIFQRIFAPIPQAAIELVVPYEEEDPTRLTYDALFVSQSVPNFMAPGSRHTATVTMRNVGTVPWRAPHPNNPGRIKLGSQEPADTLRWGVNRVDLPFDIDVSPDTNGTFTFSIVAPIEQGFHSFRWKVLREGVNWFGQSNVPLTITVAADSICTGQEIPATMVAGTTSTVVIKMKNIGSVPWTRAAGYRLGSQNPIDNMTWGTRRVELPNDVAPGAEVTLRFPVRAPDVVGHHNFQWQMVHDGIAWLGLKTPNVDVRVMPALTKAAVFVAQSVPNPMPPGSTRTVSVTMRNVGTASWTAAAGYKLGSQNPLGNTRWGFNRVLLPHDVPPNGEVTFSFPVQTHPTEGLHELPVADVPGRRRVVRPDHAQRGGEDCVPTAGRHLREPSRADVDDLRDHAHGVDHHAQHG